VAIPRVLLCVAGALVALALPVQAGAKNVGALTQLRGRAGCVGDRDAKGCTHARIGGQIASVAISPESATHTSPPTPGPSRSSRSSTEPCISCVAGPAA